MAEITEGERQRQEFVKWLSDLLDRIKNSNPHGSPSTDWLDTTKAEIRRSTEGLPGDILGDAFTDWLTRSVKGVIETANKPDGFAARMADSMAREAGLEGLDAAAQAAAWEHFTETLGVAVKSTKHATATVIAESIQQMTGLSVDASQVEGMLDLEATLADKSALGSTITDFIMGSMERDVVKEGFLKRIPGKGEMESMRRLVGGAMRIQMGGAFLTILGKIMPKQVGGALDDLSEMIDKSINLDDAIEDIIQVPMEAFISRGLEAAFNSELKPSDLSASEALKATIAGKLSQENLTKVLDNAGYRDDIRQILRENAAGNLTESDLDKGYQWNLLTREDVKKRYRDNAFEEPDAELKTKLVEMERRQKLREKVFELYGNLYRDGVATKQEVTPFLESYGYDADEVEMWFQVQELERRQRKWISDANLLKLIMSGAMTESAALEYWVLQGMERGDATTLLTLAVKEEKEAEVKNIEREVKATIAKLPKAVRDKCDDLFKPEDILGDLLAKLIGLIPAGLGEIAGALKLKDMIECALKNLGSTTPTAP